MISLRNKALIVAAVLTACLSGCASVSTMDQAAAVEAINGNPPEGQGRIYVQRDDVLGSGLYKDVYIDGKCLGETAPKTFFYADVEGNKDHYVSTESEFSPNHLLIYTKANEKYYIQQFIKMGVFVGGAALTQVDKDAALRAMQECELAVPGTCSSAQEVKLPNKQQSDKSLPTQRIKRTRYCCQI